MKYKSLSISGLFCKAFFKIVVPALRDIGSEHSDWRVRVSIGELIKISVEVIYRKEGIRRVGGGSEAVGRGEGL